MRWIVYFLLFANLGLFIWKIRDHQQAPAVTAPRLAQGNQVNRLPLLAEMSAGALRAREPETTPLSGTDTVVTVANADADRQMNGAEKPPAWQCYSVGPLRNEADTLAAQGWLQERQAVLNVREDERRETARYWVYFPPLGSRQAALKRVESLRAAGVGDLIIIPRGDMRNAISLGVYTRKSSVERRLAQLQSTGYQPLVVPRYRTVKATWVDVLVTGSSVELGAFTAAFPNLGAARRHCSTTQIAQAPKSTYNPQRSPSRYSFSGQGDTAEDDARDAPGISDLRDIP